VGQHFKKIIRMGRLKGGGGKEKKTRTGVSEVYPPKLDGLRKGDLRPLLRSNEGEKPRDTTTLQTLKA